ncbi:DUF262 domain-containing protein, partial [Hydrogenivirga sp. 128-5-R1-1]|uniref:DUF262 domain-containing protein n=1 Tax=Hydrogenivirga sp. 128-5-R1-1 TaxID=392423 RepID=UPI00015F1F1E
MNNNCIENEENKKLEKVFYKDLGKYEFEIPIYQRPYAWRPEEVETLLNDLKEYDEGEENKNDEGYFLGTLVVNLLEKDGGKEKLEVIDGQQRLTTLYLIETVFLSLKKKNEKLREKNEKIDRKIKLTYEIRESDKKFLKE